jgi:urease accessory protein
LNLNRTALLHLLQLCSPSLPVGAYSYSQGLEAAMEAGIVIDETTAKAWIVSMLNEVVSRFEAPVTLRLITAFSSNDEQAVRYWNDFFIASRDSSEFRAETIQMGYSLARLLADLCKEKREILALLSGLTDVPFPTALAAASVALEVPTEETLLGMLFSWAENQVLACVKSVPLGQVAGQRLLLSLRPDIENAASIAQTLADDEFSNWSPGLSILSMQHEVQYSRLYRS